nr:uncharacterized protein CTRU02_12145 [Colletotrichum truncatum]KAF6784934.1 hypothetical protein CTRU02_12145 [Colletotrichum truncatum]
MKLNIVTLSLLATLGAAAPVANTDALAARDDSGEDRPIYPGWKRDDSGEDRPLYPGWKRESQ